MSKVAEYSKPKGPYVRNGGFLALSQVNVGTFKPDAVRVANALSKAGYAVDLEYEVAREGEFTKDGIQKTYHVDVAIQSPKIAVEMEGKGSASKDNIRRDGYLMSHGFKAVLHFPNKTPSDKVVQAVMNYQRRFD